MSLYPNLTSDDIETITAFFNFVDTNNDGFVSIDEIQTAMAVDLNGDGTITVDEKVAAGQKWTSTYFIAEDFNSDNLLTLQELLKFNNDNRF